MCRVLCPFITPDLCGLRAPFMAVTALTIVVVLLVVVVLAIIMTFLIWSIQDTHRTNR